MVKITKSASSSIDVVFEASRYAILLLLFCCALFVGVVLFVSFGGPRRHITPRFRVDTIAFPFRFREARSIVSEICSDIIAAFSLSLERRKKNSMLHRRRVRRRPDNGHDRAEVPTHRGRERLVVFTRFIIIIIIIHFSSCGIRFQRWCSKHRACGALRAPFSTPPRTRPRKERDERFSSSHPRVQNDDEAWWSFVEWVALSLSFARM